MEQWQRDQLKFEFVTARKDENFERLWLNPEQYSGVDMTLGLLRRVVKKYPDLSILALLDLTESAGDYAANLLNEIYEKGLESCSDIINVYNEGLKLTRQELDPPAYDYSEFAVLSADAPPEILEGVRRGNPVAKSWYVPK